MTGIALGEGDCAGVVAKTRGAISDVSKRREDVRRLSLVRQVPEFLRVPRTAVAHRCGVLVTDAPAAVAALDDIHEPGLVAGIAVVVASKQVSMFVKGQALR